MERPGLRQLLDDIAAGRSMVVVYKIDRLTRSLSDFSRIVLSVDEGVFEIEVFVDFDVT